MEKVGGSHLPPVSISSYDMESAQVTDIVNRCAEPIENLDERIKETLRDHGIHDTSALRRLIRSFATMPPEHTSAVFPVDCVPESAQLKWKSDRGTLTQAINDNLKTVYVRIVGIVSSCRLYSDIDKGQDQPKDAIVSVNLKPFKTSMMRSAEELLERYSQTAQSTTSDGTIRATCSTKSFKYVFDARKGYDKTTKTDAKRISNKEIVEGDVVLVEAGVSCRRSSASKFVLADIILLADAEDKLKKPSITTRNVKISKSKVVVTTSKVIAVQKKA